MPTERTPQYLKDLTTAELFEIRRQLGLTQAEMAEYLGIKTRAWQNLETGQVEPKAAYVLAARYLALAYAASAEDTSGLSAPVKKVAFDIAKAVSGG